MADSMNKIKWVITNTGLNKIEECIEDDTKSIFLPTIKFGDAVDSEHPEGYYYEPSSDITELVNVVHTSPVNKKSRNPLDPNTAIFSTEVDESQGGFTVREIGLYGVEYLDDGSTEEYLFAIGTCEPFTKPSLSDDYVIYLSFDVCIRHDNLMQIYDRIIIDTESDYATKEDLENIVKDMLYIEGNLMEQINNNTKINGLSRVSQLYNLINESVQVDSSVFSNFTYASLLNHVNIEDVLGYWVFTYSGTSTLWRYIPDLSNYGNFLNLSGVASSFNKGYTGISPYFNITDNKYYEISADSNIDFCTNSSDLPFTIFLCLSSNTNEDSIYLAKLNAQENKYSFIIGKTSVNEGIVTLYTDDSNYVEFKTIEDIIKPNEFMIIGIRYNGLRLNPQVDIFINGKNVGTTRHNIGSYTGMNYSVSNSTSITSFQTVSDGSKQNYANAKIAKEIILNKSLSDVSIKAISYNLMTMLGLNVCYRISSI